MFIIRSSVVRERTSQSSVYERNYIETRHEVQILAEVDLYILYILS